jgi:phenylacetate-coenzyme A ligase PaaK-like adenylate-forming protein
MNERITGRFLYLNEKANPGLWYDKLIKRIIHELEIFQPVLLEANPSYLATVARFACRHNLSVYQPSAIIFSYENPGILARRQIRRAFSAPQISSYGATEAGYVLMECEEGNLHQVSSSCRIDIQYLRPEFGQQNLGRLLLTTLTNPWRFLIRFDVGDLVDVDTCLSCACGRDEGYIFNGIEGRTANLTYSTDKLPITTATVEKAISQVESVIDYQVIQHSGSYDVKIVRDEEDHAVSSTLRNRITECLLPLYGNNTDIHVKIVKEIEASPSGKYRRTYSDISIDDDKLFARGSAQQ